ncbi:MAG: hypothetical protein PVH18_03895, partial [Chloroflexota bacterium]
AALDARGVSVGVRDRRVVDVQLQWLTRQPLNQNYGYSLRIVDGDGLEVAKQDGQPGFGFLPSSGWPTGQWIDDWIGMNWPEEARQAAGEGPFDLVARLYDVASGEVVLTRLLGQLVQRQGQLGYEPLEATFEVPDDVTPLAAQFGPTDSEGLIGLAGYDLRREDDWLRLTLYWSADVPAQEDLYHFVHLEDAGGAIVGQHDGMPRHNGYPTSQWRAGEVVADEVAISLAELASGDYRLYLGLYDLRDGVANRVPITDKGGLPDGLVALNERLKLPETIAIP